MKYLIVIFVIVQVFSVYGVDEPAIVKVSGNQERNLGDSTELKCKVNAAALDYPVVWLKDNGDKKAPKQLTKGPLLVSNDDRYTLAFDRKQSSYNFKIDDLRQKDLGLYRCEIQISASDVVSAEVVVSFISYSK